MVLKDIFGVLENARTLFFVGIGGISMSSIAFVFHSKGYDVIGTDRAESAMTRKATTPRTCTAQTLLFIREP